MKTIINREATKEAILKAKPDYHEIISDEAAIIIGTSVSDDVMRDIYVIKEDEIGTAKQRLSDKGVFMTQYLATTVEILGMVVLTETKDKTIIKPKPAKK